MSRPQLVWLVTGTSSGLGREMILSILGRGDKAIATARSRSFDKLSDLKERGTATYRLDVDASLDEMHAFAKMIIEEHGRVDVLVHNAGFGTLVSQESSSLDDVAAQFSTNLFGPMNLNRAFLPYMRDRKQGTIVWMGSLCGWEIYPMMGLYCATKHAVRALSISLDQEISPLGLRSIAMEPGYFRTNTISNIKHGQNCIPVYAEMIDTEAKKYRMLEGKQRGDPAKATEIMVDVVRGEGIASGRAMPQFLPIGVDAYERITELLNDSKAVLEEWKDVICTTDYD